MELGVTVIQTITIYARVISSAYLFMQLSTKTLFTEHMSHRHSENVGRRAKQHG